MDLPKYARIEAERRFVVVTGALPVLSTAPFDRIEDRYLEGTRLRLRTQTDPSGGQTFKLCKKYPPHAPNVGPIVNVYLTADEHAALAALPGLGLAKRRYGFTDDGARVVIDVFEGGLEGLVLTEFESTSAGEVARRRPPPWAGREVTDDPFFSGANLAATSRAALARKLAEMVGGDGIEPPTLSV